MTEYRFIRLEDRASRRPVDTRLMEPSPNRYITSFMQALQGFDRALRRPALQALGLTEIGRLLGEMRRFHARAQAYGQTPAPALPETEVLMAAGCRLSSDLNEAIIEKLVEGVQAQDEAIALLSRQLAQKLQERHQQVQLLQQAQALKHQTLTTGEALGLGLVI